MRLEQARLVRSLFYGSRKQKEAYERFHGSSQYSKNPDQERTKQPI